MRWIQPRGTRFYPSLVIIVLMVLLAFSPPAAFVLSILGLASIGLSKPVYGSYEVFPVLLFGACFSTVIAAASYPLFLYEESDFTTYYSNYLVFYHYGLTADLEDYFKFGSLFEFGVPVLNYMFSILLQAPLPLMVMFLHASLQVVLLCILVVRLSKVYSLSVKDMSLLFALTFLFFKFGATLNHLSQGYASLFVLLAIFSKRYFNIWLIFACIFHLSSIFVYLLLRYILLSKNKSSLNNFSLLCVLVSISIYIILTSYYDYLEVVLPFMGKLRWAFTHVLDPAKVVVSVKGVIVAGAYLLPLVGLNLLSLLQKKKSLAMSANVSAILIFMLSFSYLPGLSVRVMAAVLSIALGLFYFLSFYKNMNSKQFAIIMMLFLIVIPFNWVLDSDLYYYNYPLASFKPLYYANEFFFQLDYQVDRTSLPSKHDFHIKNPYR